MKRVVNLLTLKKTAALTIIIISTLSLAISLLIIIQAWRVKSTLTEKTVQGLTIVADTLSTTDQGLELVNDTLNNASSSISALADSTQTLTKNISNTTTTVSSFSSLFAIDIPDTIVNTQIAITSAQSTAVVIDGIMYTLDKIPGIGIDYNPEESLGSTLGSISESLASLPESLKDIGDDLKDTNASLITLQTDLTSTYINILAVNQNLNDAQNVVAQYQEKLDQFQSWADYGLLQAPNWIRLMVIGVTFMVVWIMVAQFSLLIQGVNLLKSTR